MKRGRLSQLFGFSLLPRVREAKQQYGRGMPTANPFQMPGAFLLREGRIEKSFYHQTVADKPDYFDLADCELCDSENAVVAARST